MDSNILCLAGLLLGIILFIIGFVLGEKSEKRRADDNLETLEFLLNSGAEIVKSVCEAYKEDRKNNIYPYSYYNRPYTSYRYCKKDDDIEKESK